MKFFKLCLINYQTCSSFLQALVCYVVGSEVQQRAVQLSEVQCSHKGREGGRAEDCVSAILDCQTLFAGDQPCDQVLACRLGWACASNQLGY